MKPQRLAPLQIIFHNNLNFVKQETRWQTQWLAKNQIPWLDAKFPDFSLTLKKNLFFPDHGNSDSASPSPWTCSLVMTGNSSLGKTVTFWKCSNHKLISATTNVHQWTQNSILTTLLLQNGLYRISWLPMPHPRPMSRDVSWSCPSVVVQFWSNRTLFSCRVQMVTITTSKCWTKSTHSTRKLR